MKRLTIEKLQQKIREAMSDDGIIGILTYTFSNGNKEPAFGFDWLYDYCGDTDRLIEMQNCTQILMRQFSGIVVDDEINETNLNNLAIYLRSFFNSHKYEIETLIATTQFEYNPIDNVSEDTIEIYQGDGTEKGDQNRKLGYGTDQTRTNENIGSRSDNGSSSGSLNKGSTGGMFTESHNVAPYDSDIFHSDAQTINNHSEDAATDTTISTTSMTQGSQENNYTTTRNARDDTNNLNIDMVNTTSYTKHIIRHGNIGVTSSQELIESQREIARFSICEEIRRLFASACLIQVYNDTDSFHERW